MRLPTTYVKRLPPTLAVCLLLVVLAAIAGLLLMKRAERSEAEQAAREAYIEVCEERQEECERSLEAHHETCFGANFIQGGRHRGSTFNRQGYLRCVTVGPDRFYRERQREQQRRRGEEERLGLPPGTNL